MMTTTLDRLRTLRLGAMADAYLTQQQHAPTAALGFDERFSMLVDAEHLFRHNRALTRRLKEAKLRLPAACLEDVEATPRRGLERALVRQLATGRWVAEHHHVLITGATGQDLSRLRARAAGVPPGRPRPLSPRAPAV